MQICFAVERRPIAWVIAKVGEVFESREGKPFQLDSEGGRIVVDCGADCATFPFMKRCLLFAAIIALATTASFARGNVQHDDNISQDDMFVLGELHDDLYHRGECRYDAEYQNSLDRIYKYRFDTVRARIIAKYGTMYSTDGFDVATNCVSHWSYQKSRRNFERELTKWEKYFGITASAHSSR